ncbi:neugrin [Leptodactylus fuscus]|uniref:neugrin n=1 Tax=Leptodactylus fuscus TaxID=238119 RepID=UPI003F4E8519
MAASLLTAMCRLRALCSSQSSLLGCRGLRTRPPVNPFSGDQDELESDEESVDTLEQDVRSALKRRKKAILLKQMKRELEPPEPAERRLTWNAIQQIRYLRQEFPEEWPLSRLAVGFNVSTDAIKKVLKSKFVPSEARRMKQDASVFRVLGQNAPGSKNEQLQLVSSKDPAQTLLPSQGNKRQLLISQTSQILPPPKTSDSSEIALRNAHVMTTLTRTQESKGPVQAVFHAVPSQGLTTSAQTEPDQTQKQEEGERMYDEKWDGEVIGDEELEELANSGIPNNMKVVQKGKEFFDGDGNFLYRI